MKTKILNHRLILLAFSALLIVSCSVEDGVDGAVGPEGPQGIQGPKGEQGEPGQDGADGRDGADGQDGVDGQDGADGQDGTDGQDGNANVTSVIYDVSDWSGSTGSVELPFMPYYVYEEGAVLAYLKTFGIWYPIPNTRVFAEGGSGFLDVNTWIVDSPNGGYYYSLEFSKSGVLFEISAGDIDTLKIIIIESSTTMNGKSASTSIQQKLKKNGVDINNYHDVMDYFNLEY